MDTNSELRSAYGSSEKQTYPCVVCGGQDLSRVALADRHDLGLSFSMCEMCGMLSINPRPTESFFEWFYREKFWSTYIDPSIKTLEQLYEIDQPNLKAQQILERIEVHFPPVPSRALDIGCGLGGMLTALDRLRPMYKTFGVDPSEDGIDFVNQRGFSAYCAKFDELRELVGSEYDYIFSIHVIEHVENPSHLLSTALELLRPGGIAYFEVPDLLSLKWSKQGFDFFHIAHLHNFTRSTLSRLLSDTGFEIVEVVKGPAESWPWAIGFVCRKPAMQIIHKNKKDILNIYLTKLRLWWAQFID